MSAVIIEGNQLLQLGISRIILPNQLSACSINIKTVNVVYEDACTICQDFFASHLPRLRVASTPFLTFGFN